VVHFFVILITYFTEFLLHFLAVAGSFSLVLDSKISHGSEHLFNGSLRRRMREIHLESVFAYSHLSGRMRLLVTALSKSATNPNWTLQINLWVLAQQRSG